MPCTCTENDEEPHFGVQRLPTRMPWTVSVRRDPIYHRMFQERFAPPHKNPVTEAAARMRPGRLYPRHQFWEEAAYRASEICHEIVRPQGQDDFALAMLLRTADFVVPFTIYRRIGKGPFSDEEVDVLQRVLPQLNRCLQVQLRLEVAEGRDAVMALDGLSLAVLFLSPQARVMRANTAAEALLSTGHGLALREGRLVAASKRADDRLQRLIGRQRRQAPGAASRRAAAWQCRANRPRGLSRSWSARCRKAPCVIAAPVRRPSCSCVIPTDRPRCRRRIRASSTA